MSNDNKRRREMTTSVVTNSRQSILISILLRTERDIRSLYTQIHPKNMCVLRKLRQIITCSNVVFRDFDMCSSPAKNEILESLRIVRTFICLSYRQEVYLTLEER